jgi:hypothetical protein
VRCGIHKAPATEPAIPPKKECGTLALRRAYVIPSRLLVVSILRKEVRATSPLELLTEKYHNQLRELETRLAEVKGKLETVMEASRLVEEEGFSRDSPSLAEKKTFIGKLPIDFSPHNMPVKGH